MALKHALAQAQDGRDIRRKQMYAVKKAETMLQDTWIMRATIIARNSDQKRTTNPRTTATGTRLANATRNKNSNAWTLHPESNLRYKCNVRNRAKNTNTGKL